MNTAHVDLYHLPHQTSGFVFPPQECGHCHVMTIFFVNKWGHTYCAQCEPREEEACSTNT